MSRLWSSIKSHPYLTNVVGYTALFASADLIQQTILGGKQGQTSLDKKVTLDLKQKTNGESGPEEEATNQGKGVFPEIESRQVMDLSSGRPRKKPESPGNERTLSNDGEAEHGLQEAERPTKMKPGTWSDIDWSQTARVGLVGFCFNANFNYNWLKGLERLWPGGGVKRVAGKVFLDQLIAAPLTISAFYIGLSVLEGREDPLEDWREKFWTSYKAGVVYWSTMQAVNFTLVPPAARTVFVGGIALVWTIFLCHLRQQRGITQTHP
ncbi:mpv17-like protein [Conger conger]|uniref:mpv17-like protein n=1 Tax=Conger conger TaxID=82655 RepID=UPI002A5A59A4|nr:mpv17-like protein [Conger conger]XP_061072711.1 mpv17-like protein [Conger conger]XP_061072719.1 mpv17-like protein [Conger conger]XP_061072727.1 mpv17-like protein [Conger conger]XP_061072736.1 mpv17-like protein [Conger conger]XP_061072745.1 mpv17-like protein [Conger conger]